MHILAVLKGRMKILTKILEINGEKLSSVTRKSGSVNSEISDMVPSCIQLIC